jgi:hypothetical protein
VGLALLANLVAISSNFCEFKDEYLTFHLGDDRSLKGSPFQDYADHNTRQLDYLLAQLEERYGPFPRNTAPGAYLFKRRYLRRFYDSWVQRVYMPATWSQRLNQLMGKMLDR